MAQVELQTESPGRGDPWERIGSLRERVRQRKLTVTIEGVPPKPNNPKDQRRYEQQIGLYEQLWREGVVHGVTLRDAPALSRFTIAILRGARPALQKMRFRWAQVLREIIQEVDRWISITELGALPVYVATVGAQNRKRDEITRRILTSVQQQEAQALFFVGGGHPYRKIRALERRMPMSTTAMLDLSREMKQAGQIPAEVQLWASWDPYKEPVTDQGLPDLEKGLAQLEAKIEHGAEVILTQPAFLRSVFVFWLEEAHRRGLTSRAQIKVGVPIISSARNLRFWYALMGIHPSEKPEAELLINAWRRAEEDGRLERFAQQWNTNMITWSKELPGVSGIHYMPTYAWRRCPAILREAGFTVDDFLEDDRRVPSRDAIISDWRRLLRSGVRMVYAKRLEDPSPTSPGHLTFADEFRDRLGGMVSALCGKNGWSSDELRLYVNRIRFDQHFRAEIAFRPSDDGWSEIAINTRAVPTGGELAHSLGQCLSTFQHSGTECPDAIWLDPEPAPHERSVIWDFSDAFWKEHETFVRHTRGGKFGDTMEVPTDLHPTFLHDNARQLLRKLEDADIKRPAYMEIGIAGVTRVTRFLEVMHRMCGPRQKQHLSNLTYVLADFSQAELERARQQLGEQDEELGLRFEYLSLQAEDPVQSVRDANLAGRLLIVHATNVFDAVRTNFLAQIDGRPYRILGRAYLPMAAAEKLANHEMYQQHTMLDELRDQLTALGQRTMSLRHFLDQYRQRMPAGTFYCFWQDLFNGIRLAESYRRLQDVAEHQWVRLAGLSDPASLLLDVLISHPRNVWVPDSKSAIQSSLSLVPLLHPGGIVQLTQLGVNVQWIHQDFEGLRKYDGAVAIPLFWELYHEVALRLGYCVEARSYAEYDPRLSTSMIVSVGRGE